jgi:hypothetical protein
LVEKPISQFYTHLSGCLGFISEVMHQTQFNMEMTYKNL